MGRYWGAACCLTILINNIDMQSIGLDIVSDNKWQQIEKIEVMPLRKI